MPDSVRSYTSDELNAFHAPLHAHDAAYLKAALQYHAWQHPSCAGSVGNSPSGAGYSHTGRAPALEGTALPCNLRGPYQPSVHSPVGSSYAPNWNAWMHATPYVGGWGALPDAPPISLPLNRNVWAVNKDTPNVGPGHYGSMRTLYTPHTSDLRSTSRRSSLTMNGTWSQIHSSLSPLKSGAPDSRHCHPGVMPSIFDSPCSATSPSTRPALRLQHSVQHTSKTKGYWKGQRWITKDVINLEVTSAEGNVKRYKNTRKQTWA